MSLNQMIIYELNLRFLIPLRSIQKDNHSLDVSGRQRDALRPVASHFLPHY